MVPDEKLVKDPKTCSVDILAKAPLGEEGSTLAVIYLKSETASLVTAGPLGSTFISRVTDEKKDTVSVNKEISAMVGKSPTDKTVENRACSSFADSEYRVTP